MDPWPSLVGARYGSNVESAQLLLKAGAEVKVTDDAGCTPMHYAAGKAVRHPIYITQHWAVPTPPPQSSSSPLPTDAPTGPSPPAQGVMWAGEQYVVGVPENSCAWLGPCRHLTKRDHLLVALLVSTEGAATASTCLLLRYPVMPSSCKLQWLC